MALDLLRRAGVGGRGVVLVTCVGVLATAATIVQMALISELVSRAFFSQGGGIFAAASLLAVAVCARAALLWLSEALAFRLAARVKGGLRDRIFPHAVGLGPLYFARERAGELAATATEGLEKIEPYVARYLPQVYLSALAPAMVGAFVLYLDPLSGAILITTGPAIPVLMVLIGRRAEEHSRKQWEAHSGMGARFLEALRGLPTLRAFGRDGEEERAVERASEEFRRRTMRVLRYAFVSGFALEFVATVSVALVAVALTMRLLYGDMGFQTAFLALLLAPEFYRPLRELGARRHAGMEGKAAAERVAEILDTPPPVGDSGTSSAPRTAPRIEISNLAYSYPGAGRRALDGVDLTLEAASTTALVGPSGAGKSTLASLLLRFARPEEGKILAGGKDIAGMAVEDWRGRVALVTQRPHLFYGTAAENISLARPEASRAEVERAAALAGASEFMEELPLGYDTHIGERGARLSAGQAQRIAIARALLEDAPVLVLDEPASSLDPQSERAVERAIARLRRGRTVLVIAHRLNTARAADRIVVMEGGRVAETGTHEELAGRGGAYARMISAHGDVAHGSVKR